MGDADRFIGGIISAGGKWIYRISIVNFMWNVNKLHPKAAKVDSPYSSIEGSAEANNDHRTI